MPSERNRKGQGTMRLLLDARRQAVSLTILGSVALAIGVLVYLADRDPARAMLIPAWPRLTGNALFGAVGHWLPSFVHPFAFSLLTAMALGPAARPRYGICAAWCAVNVAFEFGQLPQVSAWLAAALHASFLPEPTTRPLAAYFLHGTFDPADLAAVLLGSLAAAAVLRLLHGASEPDHAH
jgi:hypothetical protein